MLSNKQQEILLKGINPSRISQRKGGGGKMLSYCEGWEIKAHMNRIFGFANWSWDVTSGELAFEEKGEKNWVVGYKVIGTLKIHETRATYSESAIGSAQLPQRGEAHDMAIKTAETDAFKRAAINLGDQFGLSLYNGGSTEPAVREVLVPELATLNQESA
jgi:recombination DNA repair RAD52 pathway protein